MNTSDHIADVGIEKARRILLLDESRSVGQPALLSLVKALIDYVNYSEALSGMAARRMTLQRFFAGIWPGMLWDFEETFVHVKPFGLDTKSSLFIIL